MNRQQAKDLLPIIQAFAEGKQVEVRPKECYEWNIVEENDWKYIDFEKCNLRIKPESKYRPFANEYECWQEMQKHQPFGWIKSGNRLSNIIAIREGIVTHNTISNSGYSFKSAFSMTFADGTPFGIKI